MQQQLDPVKLYVECFRQMNMSQREFAEKMGYSLRAVESWLSGGISKRNPGRQAKIAAYRLAKDIGIGILT